MSEEIEKAILEHCLEFPTQGPKRVADELLLKGIQVSSTGVRGVWMRQRLLTKHERLLRLETDREGAEAQAQRRADILLLGSRKGAGGGRIAE